VKTEHSGSKKGRGAYYGKRQDAKTLSKKARRQNGKKAAKEQY
jgi:hypothetical protein